MQNRRSRAVWFLIIALAFLFIVDPFRWFESSSIPRTRVNREVEAQMVDYLTRSSDASTYLLDRFGEKDLLLLGETGNVRQQLEFLSELIPELDRAGIRHLGFQYANREDQARIDELLTAVTFDESLAKQILFNHMAILGYGEYLQVFRVAWEVNRRKADGAPPMRIIAISRNLDYSLIDHEGDTEDPEVLAQIFADGVPDVVMAETIMTEIVQPGHKGLVYTAFPHALTEFSQPPYTERLAERGFEDQQRAGAILSSRLGDRVMTVLFHMPFPDTRSRSGLGYPLGGIIERAFSELPEATRSVGFDVADSPYAEAPVTSDSLTEGHDDEVTFEQLTDGYIVVARIADYDAVTPIPDFITADNIDRARTEFPGPHPGEITAEEMNEYIAGRASSLDRAFDEFE